MDTSALFSCGSGVGRVIRECATKHWHAQFQRYAVWVWRWEQLLGAPLEGPRLAKRRGWVGVHFENRSEKCKRT